MRRVEPAFRALQNQRRRLVIRCVQAHETLFLPDLAELVLERETGQDVADVSPERVRDVYFSLYHQHLPVLRDADVVWYEQPADRVGVTEHATDVLASARDSIDDLIHSASTT